jgi:hypothetical protein
VALGKVFSEYFGFLSNSHSTKCSILIHHPWAGTIAQIVADVPSGLNLIPPHEVKKKIN